MARRRTLVLGLDVGDGPLLERLAAEGRLPSVARLFAEGLRGELATSADFLHVSAWPSLYTGTLPGTHGVYYTFQPRPGVQGAVRFRDDQYGARPFWWHFDAAGRDVLVFDAPYTHPLRGLRGVQIFEWGTWAHYRRPELLPGSNARLLRKLLGTHPLGPAGLEAGKVGLRALEPERLAPRLVDAVHAKGQALERLLADVPWELCITVFGETHAAAHYLWPRDAASVALALGSPAEAGRHEIAPLVAVYEAFDAVLGRLLERLDDDVDLVVVSGDGVGPNRAGWHLLPGVLQATGFSSAPGGAPPGEAPEERRAPARSGPAGAGGGGLFARVRDLLPGDLRQRVSGWLPNAVSDALMRRKQAEALDWSATRAFALPTDLEGCVRINLAGREPLGIVRPGEEYEAVVAELRSTLGALIDPESGRPAVERVLLADELARGPRRDFLPDLVVHWSEELELRALALPGGRRGPHGQAGLLARGPSPDPRPGTHRPHGFLAARGQGIAAGTRFFGAHVVDFAPTLLERCGLAVPADLPGRVLEELT